MTRCKYKLQRVWFGSLIGFHCLDEVVYLCEEGIGIHAVDHAGFLHGLAAAGRVLPPKMDFLYYIQRLDKNQPFALIFRRSVL